MALICVIITQEMDQGKGTEHISKGGGNELQDYKMAADLNFCPQTKKNEADNKR